MMLVASKSRGPATLHCLHRDSAARTVRCGGASNAHLSLRARARRGERGCAASFIGQTNRGGSRSGF
eukprot:6182157-Pleurochrysis_carterae.AAC.10